MKKINIIIILTIIAVIGSSLLTQKKFNQENTQKSNAINPSGEGVKILGESTENVERTKENNWVKNKVSKKQEPKKIVFGKQKLYYLINSYRRENKLTPLNINDSLEISAKRKVEDMIENNYFRHEDKNNIESWYLFKTAGYEFKTAGENLSSGINTPWQVFDAWMNSEIHNKQLLNKTYLDMGISVDCESYKIARTPSCIVVLHLGLR